MRLIRVHSSLLAFAVAGWALVASADAVSPKGDGPSPVDPNLTVFISDLHVPSLDIPLDDARDESAPKAAIAHLSAAVDRVLGMCPSPARVVVLGDIAYLRGREADYRTSAPVLKRLETAGIELVLGLGNHDHRAAFAAVWPEQMAKSPIPGYVVREVSLGEADLILLDTLHENPEPETKNPGDGELSEAEVKWLDECLAKRTRPFILAGHHGARETRAGAGTLYDFIMRLPNCRGYIHGHVHYWSRKPLYQWYGAHAVKREVSVPSTGFYGDIGYVVCRTDPEWAELKLVQTDFYFRTYRPEDAARPPEWAQMVRENEGESCRMRLR